MKNILCKNTTTLVNNSTLFSVYVGSRLWGLLLLSALSDGWQSSLHKYISILFFSCASYHCLKKVDDDVPHDLNFQSAASLDFGRFCTGFGVGVFSYVVWSSSRGITEFSNDSPTSLTGALLTEQVPVFIAEIAPKALRGGLTTLNQVNIFLF